MSPVRVDDAADCTYFTALLGSVARKAFISFSSLLRSTFQLRSKIFTLMTRPHDVARRLRLNLWRIQIAPKLQEHVHDITDFPKSLGHARGHCGAHFERLVDANKIIIQEMQLCLLKTSSAAEILVRYRPKCGPETKRWASETAQSHPARHGRTLIAERLIGSIRRECTDHLIVVNEDHLRRILAKFAAYYNNARTHVSLGKDAPYTRPIERFGTVVAHAILGGLHHRYTRIKFSEGTEPQIAAEDGPDPVSFPKI